jgi:cell wall-associated NlpC family hydrolase
MKTMLFSAVALLFLGSSCMSPAKVQELRERRLFRADGVGIVDIARRYVGVPYRYGGSSPSGFDCSGLVRYVYARAGYSVPRSATEQWKDMGFTRVPQPGDLVFFKANSSKISHVGIYAGNFLFIHAPRTGKNVGFDDIRDSYWNKSYAGSRTVFQ